MFSARFAMRQFRRKFVALDSIAPRVLQIPPAIQKLDLGRHTYKRLIFVGHSEGAVVIRRAMCIEYKRTGARSKLLKAQLALFAPAHLGFTPSGWVGGCLAVGYVEALIAPFLGSSSAFVEMKGKELLNQIEKDTSTFIAKSPKLAALRARVLFGTDENVVVMGEFTSDLPEPPEAGRNHASICKPESAYERPLQFALNIKKNA
jgi:hypothetical protein